MLTAAGKPSQDGPVRLLVIGLTKADLERLQKGGSIEREFAAIDPALGEGALLVAGVGDEDSMLSALRERFPDMVDATVRVPPR